MSKKIFAVGNTQGIQKVICKNCGQSMEKKERVVFDPKGSIAVKTYWFCSFCLATEEEQEE